MNSAFEEKINSDLRGFLLLQHEIDAHFPQALDIEDKWDSIAQSYMPDGIREFRNYPAASLAWVMYIGMAVTQYWEEDWEVYGHLDDIYLYLRDKQGYDTMDEYIRRKVLHLKGTAFKTTEALVQECAKRTYSALCREHIKAGTHEAFEAYTACLHQLYLMGMAVQLHRLGYHMQAMGV